MNWEPVLIPRLFYGIDSGLLNVIEHSSMVSFNHSGYCDLAIMSVGFKPRKHVGIEFRIDKKRLLHHH